MKGTLLFLTMFCATVSPSANPELSEVRNLFVESAGSRSSADKLVKLLAPVDGASQPVLICYKGVAQMMLAKHGFNPINKYSSFRRGKTLIEQAVIKAPTNIEVRYLRFMIQSNLPGFLNYNDEINEDKNYLLSKVKTLTDNKLRENIIGLLSSSSYCSAEEKKGLSL